MTRLQLIISDDLHKKLKVIAALEGRDMSEIVRSLIVVYVEKAEKRKLIPMKLKT